jgi:hypothetical protein
LARIASQIKEVAEASIFDATRAREEFACR